MYDLSHGFLVPRRRKKRKSHYHVGAYTSTKTGQTYRYRSGWELAYFKYLDSNSSVVSYEYERIVIEYVSNVRSGKIRKYLPDFFVEYEDGRNVLVEIKPKRRLTQARIKKKLSAAERWCNERGVTLEIVTEVELRLLGLIA